MEITTAIMEYIKPELLVLIPVLFIIGELFKRAEAVADKHIPILLGVCSILLAVIYVLATAELPSDWQGILMGVFVAITQGILCAGAAVYVDQLAKQASKDQ